MGSHALTLKSRIVAAIRGAFVADAASMGTHWIYDPAKMAESVPSLDAPEFKTPPTPSFYSSEEFPGHYMAGMPSPYGEQLLFVTEYCAKSGSVDGATMSQAMLEWANTFGGRPDHALTEFADNMKSGNKPFPVCGADDDQAHIYMKVVPVTCLYAGKPELQEKVAEAIRVHQKNEKAVAYGLASACILEAVLLGSTLRDAVTKCSEGEFVGVEPEMKQDVLASLKRARESAASKQSLEDLLLQLSHEKIKDPTSGFYNFAARSCALPGAFIGPMRQLFDVAKLETVADDVYMKATRENILVSGDTCSRSVLLGAVLAALSGGPPKVWLDKMDLTVLDKINSAAEKIAELATNSQSGEKEL